MQEMQTQQLTGWKEAYKEALFELDPGRLRPKIEAARQRVEERLSEVLSEGGTLRELTELGDAKRTLLFLERQGEN